MPTPCSAPGSAGFRLASCIFDCAAGPSSWPGCAKAVEIGFNAETQRMQRKRRENMRDDIPPRPAGLPHSLELEVGVIASAPLSPEPPERYAAVRVWPEYR